MIDSIKAMESDFSYLSAVQLETAIIQGFVLRNFSLIIQCTFSYSMKVSKKGKQQSVILLTFLPGDSLWLAESYYDS